MSTPSRRATINAVAKKAGVSTATVSRVLTGVAPVNDSTRERVVAAVEELNYRPSELTRAVFARRSNTIGLLLADMRNPYYIDLVDGVSQIASISGSLPFLALGKRDATTERRMLTLMDSHRVRGLIATIGSDGDDLVNAMAEAGTECVFMAREAGVDHPRIHTVRLDDHAAGRIAWEHLSSIGRSKVLIVTQGEDTPTRRDRVSGFVEAASSAGIQVGPENILRLETLEVPSEKLRTRLLAGQADGSIDAVFAITGIATFRAYEALTNSGFHVPQDIAMLGFDDFTWADYLAPSLSVIVQPAVEMGKAAAQIILDEPGQSRRLLFEPTLVVRDSTTLVAPPQ